MTQEGKLHSSQALQGEPLYKPGMRVKKVGEDQSGRVQGVSYSDGQFVYVVKWDIGPTTPHAESDLRPDSLPTHYP